MVLEVSGNKYNLKFGYKAVAQDCVLKKVSSLQNIIQGMDSDNTYDSVSEILELLAEVIATGLKDYDKSLDDTYELLEEYFNENKDNNEVSVISLYGEVLKELLNNGFLVKMFPQEINEIMQKEVENQKATKKAVKKAKPKN